MRICNFCGHGINPSICPLWGKCLWCRMGLPIKKVYGNPHINYGKRDLEGV
ncbi:hypothetical protein LCGC14_0589200 [marine sediment metagenome]|uniref:Uncharacterized protein n=1 Tax=marine sediment metagenome TaxID=412755 RepID=A0A0F9UME9_9ZZZZ